MSPNPPAEAALRGNSTSRTWKSPDPGDAAAFAAGILARVWHGTILSWQSTWVVVLALTVAPTPALSPFPGLPALATAPPVPFPAIASASPALPIPSLPMLVPVGALLPRAGLARDEDPSPPPARQPAPDPAVAGVPVTITAYASDIRHTDDEPFVTATGRLVRPGTLAVSRDLLRTYTPGAPFDFGDRVRLSRYGEFIVDDTMNPRWTHRVDIWVPSVPEATEFGLRRGRLHLVSRSERP